MTKRRQKYQAPKPEEPKTSAPPVNTESKTIISIRERLDMTQLGFASMLGVSKKQLQNVEDGCATLDEIFSA